MQLIKKQERVGEYAFYIGIAIHLLLMTIGYGDFTIPFQGRLMQVAFGLFCIKIITTNYLKNEWIGMIALGILGGLSYIGTKDEYVISVIVMIFAAKNADMRKMCYWIFIVALVSTIIIATLSLVGIGGMPVDIRDYGRGGVETRWCLGFGHANNLHGAVWYIIALATYVFYDKLNWKFYLLISIGNTILFYFTASKGGFIATQMVIVAVALLKYINALARQMWIYMCGTLGIISIVTISFISVSVEWFRHPVLMFIDEILTGRINLAYQHAHISMWKLLSSAGEFQNVVDNGWITVFFHYGYIVGILHIIFNLVLIYLTWKEKDGILLTVAVTCAFYTFMEASFTMNSAYLLCNLSYVVAMILLSRANTHMKSETTKQNS